MLETASVPRLRSKQKPEQLLLLRELCIINSAVSSFCHIMTMSVHGCQVSPVRCVSDFDGKRSVAVMTAGELAMNRNFSSFLIQARMRCPMLPRIHRRHALTSAS